MRKIKSDLLKTALTKQGLDIEKAINIPNMFIPNEIMFQVTCNVVPELNVVAKYLGDKTKYIYKQVSWGHRTITIAAVINTRNEGKYFQRKVLFGYAIRNPQDTPNDEIAKKVAKGRAEKKPIGFLLSDNGMLLKMSRMVEIMDDIIRDIKKCPERYIAAFKIL